MSNELPWNWKSSNHNRLAATLSYREANVFLPVEASLFVKKIKAKQNMLSRVISAHSNPFRRNENY